MQTIIGVRFKKAGKIYYYSPGQLDIELGDNVIVDTARGTECGVTVLAPREVEDSEIVKPLKVVHRIATDGTVKGTGSFCLQWACDQHPHQRIDTHPDNAPLRHVLEKLGFVECGTIYVDAHEKHSPRVAYEHV